MLGRLKDKVDPKNQKTEYVYDDSGRLTETRQFKSGSLVKTTGFGYNKVGSLMSYSDGATSAQYGYDDLHRKEWGRVFPFSELGLGVKICR